MMAARTIQIDILKSKWRRVSEVERAMEIPRAKT